MGLFRAFVAAAVLVALYRLVSNRSAGVLELVPGGEPRPRNQHRLRGGWRRRVQGRVESLLPLRAAGWIRLHRHMGVATRETRGSMGHAGQPRNRGQLAQPRSGGGLVARRALAVLHQRPTWRRRARRTSGSSYREHVHDPFDWQAPVNLGSGVNSIFNDSGPSLRRERRYGRAATLLPQRPPGPGGDRHLRERPAWRRNVGSGHHGARSSADRDRSSAHRSGSTGWRSSSSRIVLEGSGPWTCGRRRAARVFDPWSAPTNLGAPVNTALAEVQPYITSDRQTLYFQSPRPGGFGSQDIWMTTRTKH